jgi:hypothetical protein
MLMLLLPLLPLPLPLLWFDMQRTSQNTSLFLKSTYNSFCHLLRLGQNPCRFHA